MAPGGRTIARSGLGRALLASAALLPAGCGRSPAPTPSPSPVPARPSSAVFKALEGRVEVRPWGELEWRAATLVMPLRENDQVWTRSGRAQIRMHDGTEINLGPESLARIETSHADPASGGTRSALSIQAGEANFQTSPAGTGRTTLGTPSVTTRVERDSSGSLQVGEDGATGVRLFRGTGEAETKAGQKLALGANEGVQVGAGGTAGSKVALPVVPELLAPDNLTQFSYPDVERGVTSLRWRAAKGAHRYRVVVDYSPGFTRPLHDRKDYTEGRAELGGLAAGSYCWRVAALTADGLEGAYSETWRFTLAKSNVQTGPPPKLQIDALELKGSVLLVRGKTEPGATLLLNDERVRVEDDGTFSEFVAVAPGSTGEVLLRATSRAGGVTEQRRRPAAAR